MPFVMNLVSKRFAKKDGKPAVDMTVEKTVDKPAAPASKAPKVKRVPKFATHRGIDGQWYWHLQAANGRILASGEGHRSKRDALRAVAGVKKAAAAAVL